MLTVSNPETFRWDLIPLDDCLYGNAMDTFLTLKIFDELEPQTKDLGIDLLLKEMLYPAISLFADSEYRGCDIDTKNLDKLDKELNLAMIDLEDIILSAIGKQINISSGQQLKHLFYTDEDGLGLFPIAESDKTGDASLNEKVLSRTLTLIEEELITRGEKTKKES